MYAKCKKCGSLLSPYGEQICKCELIPTQKVPVKKGVEYDCPMFEVRCKQPCVSGGLRRTDKCPYDNYKGASTMTNSKIPTDYSATYAKNADGGYTLVSVQREINTNSKGIMPKGAKPKGADTMADNSKKANNKPANGGGRQSTFFQPTFRKYADMNDGEQAAFRQGAKTSENKVKERLGFIKPRDK